MRNEFFFEKGDLFIMQETRRIYVITNKLSGKAYVGQTKHSVKRRVQWHIRDAKRGRNTLIAKAIRDYGIDNFEIKTLEDGILSDYIDECERYWIEKLNTRMPFGYNMDAGGKSGNYGNKHHGYGKSRHGEVIMYDKNTMKKIFTFSGVMDAERYLQAHGKIKANHWAITKCCFGRSKSAYGYKWKFENYKER